MSEAKQLYDDILYALSPLLPRMVYQDVRRVRTLAWAITGLCLLHSVRLSAWAEVVKPPDPERRAPGPALLALATSPCDCSCPMVSACDTGGALWLACGPASLSCPRYDRPHALRADPGLPRVSWPSDSFGVASHAPQKYPGQF